NRQQKDIARLEALIEKFRYKKNKAAFAQSKIKYLERMERIESPSAAKKNFSPRFTAAIKGGKQVLETKDLVVGYDRPLATVNLEILRGQRIAVIGPNGEGKSTFVKTIVSAIPPLGGEFLLGHQIEIGYFDQELAQFRGDHTVLDELWDEYPELTRTEVRTVLGNFLFTADEVFKEVGVLSGGEKVRLSLAKLMLKQANFLVLDEPTNHLDIPGKEALEDALKDYEGTLLVVSHDRWFINKIATSLLIFKDGNAVYYPYSYAEYMEGVLTKQAEEKAAEEKKKEASRPVRKKNWKNEVKRLEEKIGEAEEELERLRALRFEPEYYHDYRKMEELEDQISTQHNVLAAYMKEWEEAEENLANG
ncbi:MAG: ABC-F family ATP-binding cassette domain-containing protein, partial [Erysipelotrichales bacterium]|nr:ABC-F family ATP-binding cassette domain-containing protein [Erysipelotrichales bacterium]